MRLIQFTWQLFALLALCAQRSGLDINSDIQLLVHYLGRRYESHAAQVIAYVINMDTSQ